MDLQQGDGVVSASPALAVLVVCLVGVTVVVARVAHVGVARATVTASVRAVVQLAAVSLVIAAVLRSWWATGAFVLVMLAVAGVTSARRLGSVRGAWPAVVPIGLGALPVVAGVTASGAMPLTTVAVLPVAGILVGGAMTATSLAGRRALDELRTRHGEYEAALAIGLTERDAALEICRTSATQALVPPLDQTRTVGLVTLPGAFVGVLLGGGSAAQAGATQLLVLVALLAAQTVAVALTVELVARGHVRRDG